MGWVYGIQCGEFIKVGYTASAIKSRTDTMRLYNPHSIKIVLRRRTDHPYWVERRLHQILAEKAVGREWFRITVSELREAACAAVTDLVVAIEEQARWQEESSAKAQAKQQRKLERTRGRNVEKVTESAQLIVL